MPLDVSAVLHRKHLQVPTADLDDLVTPKVGAGITMRLVGTKYMQVYLQADK